MIAKLLMTMTCIFIAFSLQAQGSGFDAMMLSNGKLYTVVGVLLIIFIGIILYLYNTDKKLRSLEDQIKSNE